MKILVPVDGSLASMNALLKAVEIAKRENASLKLLSIVNHDISKAISRNEKLWHSVDGSIISGRQPFVAESEAINQMKHTAMEILNTVTEEVDTVGIPVEKEVVVGEPYAEILDCAKNGEFDLIVIGNRGFSKIKRFFLGSVAQRVISEAECPVLVIHTDAEE